MANYTNWIPSSYDAAKAMLKGRPAHKIGNNTRLVALPSDPSRAMNAKDLIAPVAIAIRYHNTDIVIFHLDGTITLNSGGFRTTTTKGRMNGALDRSTYRVVQRDWAWYLVDTLTGTEQPYEDGVRFRPLGPICVGCTRSLDFAGVE